MMSEIDAGVHDKQLGISDAAVQAAASDSAKKETLNEDILKRREAAKTNLLGQIKSREEQLKDLNAQIGGTYGQEEDQKTDDPLGILH